MLSVLINTHLVMAAKDAGVERYFYASSACVCAADKQTDPNVTALKEEDAYPAMLEDGYRWKKLFSERMCRHFRAKLIPVIVTFLICYDRDKLKNAQVNSSQWCWMFIGVGLFFFVAGARTLQARLALTSLPFLVLGIVLCVWERNVASILLFPNRWRT